MSNEHELRDMRNKDWFWTSDSIFDMDISEHAKIIYIYLCRCADSSSTCFPSYNDIGKKCGFSRDTAKRYVKELISVGLIEKVNRKSKEGKENYSNLYTLYNPPKKEKEGVGVESTQVGVESTQVGAESTGKDDSLKDDSLKENNNNPGCCSEKHSSTSKNIKNQNIKDDNIQKLIAIAKSMFDFELKYEDAVKILKAANNDWQCIINCIQALVEQLQQKQVAVVPFLLKGIENKYEPNKKHSIADSFNSAEEVSSQLKQKYESVYMN